MIAPTDCFLYVTHTALNFVYLPEYEISVGDASHGVQQLLATLPEGPERLGVEAYTGHAKHEHYFRFLHRFPPKFLTGRV